MKKLMMSVVALSMLSACATDPYTGESKVSKTAWGTGIGAVAGAGIGALVGGEKVLLSARELVLPAVRQLVAIWIFKHADYVRNWWVPACKFRK